MSHKCWCLKYSFPQHSKTKYGPPVSHKPIVEFHVFLLAWPSKYQHNQRLFSSLISFYKCKAPTTLKRFRIKNAYFLTRLSPSLAFVHTKTPENADKTEGFRKRWNFWKCTVLKRSVSSVDTLKRRVSASRRSATETYQKVCVFVRKPFRVDRRKQTKNAIVWAKIFCFVLMEAKTDT